MSIYGEPANQFRPRPAKVILLTFAFFTTAIGAVVGPVLFSATRVLTTRALRPSFGLHLHAPIASDPSLGLYPLHANYVVIGAAVASAVVALLVTLFIAFYPASQRLANRLSLFTIGTALVAFGAVAPVADRGLAISISRWQGHPRPVSIVIVALASAALLLITIWFERQTVSLLGNSFEVGNPLQRFGLWAIRIPVPYGALAILSYLGDWMGGVAASVGVIVGTLADDLVRYPRLRYESIDRHRMYEGLAAAIIVALTLVGGSSWLFGLPVAGRPSRAVVYENGSVSIVSSDDLIDRIRDKESPKIEMKWSEEK